MSLRLSSPPKAQISMLRQSRCSSSLAHFATVKPAQLSIELLEVAKVDAVKALLDVGALATDPGGRDENTPYSPRSIIALFRNS